MMTLDVKLQQILSLKKLTNPDIQYHHNITSILQGEASQKANYTVINNQYSISGAVSVDFCH